MSVISGLNSRIDVVDWKLIGSCNLRCGHCYGPPKSEGSLPSESLRNIINVFSRLEPEWVVLTGGEPLMVGQIDKIMGDITDTGVKLALSTNTTFFRKYQEAIERNVSSLNIPLDGSTPKIHSMQRGGDLSTYDSFFDVLNHYQKNSERKPELLRVGTVCSGATKGDLFPIAEKLEPFADIIDRWKIYELVEYETQRDLRRPLIQRKEEFENEISRLMDKLNGSRLATKLMHSSAKDRDRAYFMINPRGLVVMPTCIEGVSYEVPVGDILNDPLQEILTSWNGMIDQTNYYGNHEHYSKNGEEINLRVLN